jgi:peptidoglycan/LPS O-acetylase OafA/YrhL
MNAWTAIKAPAVVQFNRIAFAIYTAIFGLVLWRFHRIASVEGTAIFLCMFLLSVQGLASSCIRAPCSRWIMAVVSHLISGILLTGMLLVEFNSPKGCWDWLLTGLCVLPTWFSVPLMLSFPLFRHISFDKGPQLGIEIQPAKACAQYFKVTGR